MFLAKVESGFNLKGLAEKLKGKLPQEKAYSESLKHLIAIQDISHKMFMNKDKWEHGMKEGVPKDLLRDSSKLMDKLARELALIYGVDWETGKKNNGSEKD